MNIDDEDDEDSPPGSNMGDLTFTPMYRYVYNYRPPPAYPEVHSYIFCFILDLKCIHSCYRCIDFQELMISQGIKNIHVRNKSNY